MFTHLGQYMHISSLTVLQIMISGIHKPYFYGMLSKYQQIAVDNKKDKDGRIMALIYINAL